MIDLMTKIACLLVRFNREDIYKLTDIRVIDALLLLQESAKELDHQAAEIQRLNAELGLIKMGFNRKPETKDGYCVACGNWIGTTEDCKDYN